MIVNCRIEIDDETRNILARLNKPSAPKRLATRKEVADFVDGCIAGLAAVQEPEPFNNVEQPQRVNGKPSLMELVMRARSEDREELRGKSDGFVIGWCKVKYANELRGSDVQ